MQSDSWYYARANQQYGPVPQATLAQMYATGQVSPTDLVWADGMPNWAPASTVLGPAAAAVGAPASSSAAAAPSPYAGAPQPQGVAYQSPAGYYNPATGQPQAMIGYYGAPAAYTATYAGFWLRVVAYVIDYIITFIVGFVIGIIVAAVGAAAGGGSSGNPTAQNGLAALNAIVGILVTWLYYALMESSPKQATLGKMALGLYVTDTNGGRITFARATGRFFGKILSAIILAIGFIMAAFTERKQALHDLLANTLVLRRPS